MTTITAQEARNTKIFVINNYTNEVEETTLFEHVAESAEETTSPRGIEYKMFVTEVEDEERFTWELREWMANGKSRLIDTCESEEAANDEWFDRTYKFDFLPDDQRDTNYWYSQEDAEKELNERMSNQ